MRRGRALSDVESRFDLTPAAPYDDDGDDKPQRRTNGNADHHNGKPTNGAKQIAQDRFGEFNRFVDVTMRDLPRSELLVWLVLFRDARDGVARTSRTDIARRAGVSTKTVTRAIAALIKRKLVRLLYRGGINRGVSRYAILPKPRGT